MVFLLKELALEGNRGGLKVGGNRAVLGRGLGSLIPVEVDAGMGPEHFLCPIERIVHASLQPRTLFDDEALSQLATSLAETGLLQPIVVRREGENYVVVAGERRSRAARLAGLKKVPVVVKDVSPQDAYELALVENVQREDLTPLEEAEAYRRLMDDRGYTQDTLARRIGKDRTTVANTVRLIKLPKELKALLETGQISAGHARALLGVDNPAEAKRLAKEVVRKKMSVRATEEAVRSKKGGGKGRKPQKADQAPGGPLASQQVADDSSARMVPLPQLDPFPSFPELPPLPSLSELDDDAGEAEVGGPWRDEDAMEAVEELQDALQMPVRLRINRGSQGAVLEVGMEDVGQLYALLAAIKGKP